jgi:hypothetical protein
MKTISPKQIKGKKAPGHRIAKMAVKGTDHEKAGSHASTFVASKTDYRTLLEKCRVGLYVIQKGCFSYVNSVLSDTLGYESPEHLIGKSFPSGSLFTLMTGNGSAWLCGLSCQIDCH